jgi:uncharacterized protein
MLITFSVGNYKSFKQVVTFSLMAAKLTSKNKELDQNNVFPVTQSLNLLKSAAIYGPNASGKSNLLKAIAFMRHFVLTSSKESQSTEPITVDSFRLSTETESNPSFFEIVFFLGDKRYRYGFEADTHRIHAEWLYHAGQKETRLFLRDNNRFDLSSVFKEGKGLETKTRDNALFLSVVAQFNGAIAQNILKWFKRVNIISGLSDNEYRGFTLNSMTNKTSRERIISFVKQLDFGISDIMVERSIVDPDVHLPKDMPQELKSLLLKQAKDLVAFNVATSHKKYNNEKTNITLEKFDIEEESEGTQKLFFLSGPLLDTLQSGKVLIVDELDARFHPKITASVINLFNSNIINPNNAQLIFATHDTNLLDRNFFRRDQIWFTEKDKYGATDLYSLVEYRIQEHRVRNDASFEKDYIEGRYGAIPFIGDIRQLVGDTNAEES